MGAEDGVPYLLRYEKILSLFFGSIRPIWKGEEKISIASAQVKLEFLKWSTGGD